MKTGTVLFLALLAGFTAPAISTPVAAQTSPEVAAPDYGSSASTGFLSNTHFNTPESDGRPGVKFFAEGMAAYSDHDFKHAINRLELSAYWAYEPAAYNLGILYFKGEGGFPVNRPLGTAWMFIAAENGSPMYEYARHVMVMDLDDSERTEALQDYQRLQEKYGQEVVMRRAKAQWSFAKAQKTGSRLGGAVGELKVGLHDGSGTFAAFGGGSDSNGSSIPRVDSTGFQVLNGGSEDGTVAYRQMQESANPYDVKFLRSRSGTATVGPLQQVGKHASAPAAKQPNSSTHGESSQSKSNDNSESQL